MAIISPDTYIYNVVQETLNKLLPKCYIIRGVLKDFDKEARENFINTFCGDNPKKSVNISYVFPQEKENLEATYVVRMGNANFNGNSLGSNSGEYYTKRGDEKVSHVKSELDETGNYIIFKFDTLLAEKPSSPQISLAECYGEYFVEGDTFYLTYKGNEHMLDKTYQFYYEELLDENEKGFVKGFTVDESVEVIGISHNVDIARCLDAILKMIFIISKETLAEQNTFQLQNLNFGDMMPIELSGERPIFGRPVTVSFTLDHTIDYAVVEQVKEIVLHERVNVTNGKKERE